MSFLIAMSTLASRTTNLYIDLAHSGGRFGYKDGGRGRVRVCDGSVDLGLESDGVAMVVACFGGLALPRSLRSTIELYQ